jgi:glycosyltransferase involved in cell wall biosynthesis
MSVHVNFFCQFNNTGVGRHSENAFFSMSRSRPDGVALEYVNNARDDSVRRMLANVRPETDVTLIFWRLPAEFVLQVPGRRILWWFFESDRLPQKWLDDLVPYEQIWAPSPWAREVLLAHGVANNRVRVVESGVNIRVYQPGPPRVADDYVFLSVGKYEKRKSIDEVIEAFVAEFPATGHARVQLWLKADFPMFPERVQQLAARWAHESRIRIVSGHFSDEQMADLYRSADAFVFPSKAEGFGLPLLEAIACGLPAIATRFSAQAVILDHIPGLFAPVAYTVAPIVDADYAYFYAAEYGGLDFGNWALPSVESIRGCMRDVYEQRQAWRERALRASDIVRAAFSWDAIGRRALAQIDNPGALGPKEPTPVAAR